MFNKRVHLLVKIIVKKFLVSRFPGFVHLPSDKSNIKMKTVADTGEMMLTGETTSKNMSKHKSYSKNFAWPGAGSILGHYGEISAINRLKNGTTEIYLSSLFLHHCKYMRVRYRQEPVSEI
jgi:hypothetical protein